MPTLLALSVCLALGTSACATTGDQPVHSHKPTAPAHTPPSADALTEARVHDLGHIGQWMIARDGSIAGWLGIPLDGKPVREPINVIFVDSGARDADDAKARLVEAMTRAGYPARAGHSWGYRGVINGQVHGQLPEMVDHAFSTHPFEENNNHGRIFGPQQTPAGWVFIGALSREDVDYKHMPPRHMYSSFNRARDELVNALADRTAWQREGTVPLHNASGADSAFTTADHDGTAVVVRLR